MYPSEASGAETRQWYRDTYGDTEPDVAPHCDTDVLHAPGECVYCDCHPKRQLQREADGINYTGHHDPDKRMCPSEADRPLDTINLWGGNRPVANTDPSYGRGRAIDVQPAPRSLRALRDWLYRRRRR
jgi:hypothetical protein